MEKIAISYTFDNEEITGVLFYNLGERNERATLSLPMVIPAFNRWSSLREMLMKTFDVCPSPTASIVRRWKFGKRMPRGNYTCVESFPRIGHWFRIECQTLRRRNDFFHERIILSLIENLNDRRRRLEYLIGSKNKMSDEILS